jgi:predicted nucleic acid-binding protein
MIVVADTTPLNYLVLIDQAALLPRLFGRVLIPPAVLEELRDLETPEVVRAWIRDPPPWLQLMPLDSQPDPLLDYLDPGEREAIALAEHLHADRLLLDDAAARREAALRNLAFIGTLGILREAARRDMIELPAALTRVQVHQLLCGPRIDPVPAGGGHRPKEDASINRLVFGIFGIGRHRSHKPPQASSRPVTTRPTKTDPSRGH